MKKTKLLTVLIATFLLTLQSFAQKNETPAPLQSQPDFLKHEIGVSYGLFATPIIIPILQATLPNFNLSYYYNINEHHAVGVTLSTWIPITYNSYYGQWLYPDGVVLTPQVNYRISYHQKKIINLYSIVSLGWKIPIGLKDNWVLEDMMPFPAVHVTFIGMRIGNHQDAGTVEIGYGTHGIIVLGYSHKFKNKAK